MAHLTHLRVSGDVRVLRVADAGYAIRILIRLALLADISPGSWALSSWAPGTMLSK